MIPTGSAWVKYVAQQNSCFVVEAWQLQCQPEKSSAMGTTRRRATIHSDHEIQFQKVAPSLTVGSNSSKMSSHRLVFDAAA